MSDYTLTQAEYSRLSRRLNTAQNKLKKLAAAGASEDDIKAAADKVITEVRFATGIFEAKGYPDAWARWERASEDAELAKRKGGWI